MTPESQVILNKMLPLGIFTCTRWVKTLLLFGFTWTEIDEVGEFNDYLRTKERKDLEYRQGEVRRVRRFLAEFETEFPEDWRMERKTTYLNGLIGETQSKIDGVYARYDEMVKNDTYENRLKLLKIHDVGKWEGKIKSLQGSIKNMKKGSITQADIMRAKEARYDIEVKNGMARCIFHADINPSMQIFKDNKFRCYGCGEHGDRVDFEMKRYNLGFVNAVKKLGGL